MEPAAERTAAALEALVVSLRETVADLQELIRRAQTLREDVASGAALGDIMAAEARPLIITRLTEITDRLHQVGGAVRRSEAHQLRGEGYTQEGIAEIFGVSRQRAAALLQPPSDGKPKRPRPAVDPQ